MHTQSQTKVLAILFGTLLLDMIGFGMVLPLIPTIFTDSSSPWFVLAAWDRDWWYFIAGVVVGIGGIMQFIAAPILGELSDMYGRKTLLVWGVGLLAIAHVFFALGIAIQSLVLLFVSRAITGLSGGNFAIAQAAIADITKPHERAQKFGVMSAAFGAGFVLGPVFGGWLASVSGDPTLPFWCAALLGLINMVFVYVVLPETNHNVVSGVPLKLLKAFHDIRDAFLDKEVRPMYLTSFLYMSGFTFFTTFIGFLLLHEFSFTIRETGLFFGVIGIWVIVVQLVIIFYIAKRYTEHQALYFGLLLLAATIAIYPFLDSVRSLYVVIPFMALAQGLALSNVNALISRGVSEKQQGAALGINGSLLALSQGVIPPFAGLVSSLGPSVPFLVGSCIVLCAWWYLYSPLLILRKYGGVRSVRR